MNNIKDEINKFTEKQDILDFFDKQNCNNCVFAKECEKNQIEYDALTLCALFGLI